MTVPTLTSKSAAPPSFVQTLSKVTALWALRYREHGSAKKMDGGPSSPTLQNPAGSMEAVCRLSRLTSEDLEAFNSGVHCRHGLGE